MYSTKLREVCCGVCLLDIGQEKPWATLIDRGKITSYVIRQTWIILVSIISGFEVLLNLYQSALITTNELIGFQEIIGNLCILIPL